MHNSDCKNNEVPIIDSLDLRFDAEEDRILIEAKLQDEGQLVLSLTRRILGSLLQHYAESIQADNVLANSQATNVSELLQMKHANEIKKYEEQAHTSSQQHPKFEADKEKMRLLVIEVTLSKDQGCLKIVFSGRHQHILNDNSCPVKPAAALLMDEPCKHKFFEILVDKCNQAGWGLRINFPWLNKNFDSPHHLNAFN